MTDQNFTDKLIGWYNEHSRSLPWRKTKDPYPVWLSEVILQQTRVEQGLPYYHKFIDSYPNIEDLAASSEEEVLRLWQGLGYYSRGRNLLKGAQQIVYERDGVWPDNYKELQNIKGIGKYIAAAIASFCFGEYVPVVDGNVYRFLSRYFGILEPINTGKSFRVFFEVAAELQSTANDPADFNQALMEFGAMHCKPRKPDCASCVFEAKCYARDKNSQELFPVKPKKKKSVTRNFHYFLIKKENRFLVRKRGVNDIWQGLYEFPLIEGEELSNENLQTLPVEIDMVKIKKLYEVKHILSHQTIFATFYDIIPVNDNVVKEERADYIGDWLLAEEIEEKPKPILIDKFLNEYL
ncbi:A/G-specific adenine glycosylase [Marinigracilibium pacificum]|uniref:Adenine DNA glycosylase n=1 Tax=Marinigracilibium pacificum TaxID=2729599 RepID=A0A848IV24_9BACT|nr:A/G-specific adenine glycosylase [Marinigracilibium pacificum]NMM47081.1 A/G-specific adenine glycosylase [Marinigracilibium pacificum]